MRIAICYDSLFPVNTGGGERVYRAMADLLVARGHSVDYLTRDQWLDAAQPETSFEIVPVWRGDIYDSSGTRTTSSALGFARGIFRALRGTRGRYDLVIASALPVLTLITARLALAGTPTFLVGDWLEVWGWRKWRAYAGVVPGSLAFALQWLGLRSADLHTVNSSFTAARVMRYRRRARPLVLGLVDLGGEPRKAQVADSPPYLLFIGRLIADKRADCIPAALALVRETIPDLTARFVGSGPEESALRRAIAEAGLEKSADVLGRVDDEDLDRLIASAVVLINPSEREGFGLVVVEAAARAVPTVLVAGEDNAAMDLIVDGVNGAIAPSIDPHDLAEQIARVIVAGDAMRRSTAGWYTRERVARGLAASLDDLLERAAGSV